MTNASKCKQANKKCFYGKSKKSLNFYGNQKVCYLTPLERKVLRERKELIKSQLHCSGHQEKQIVKQNLLETHDLKKISVDSTKNNEKTNGLQKQKSNLASSKSPLKLFPIFQQKSPMKKLQDFDDVLENKITTKPLQRLDNSVLFSDSPTKLFPIFYKKTTQKSPRKLIRKLSAAEVNPAAVSPQNLHISIPKTSKSKRLSTSLSPRTQQMIIDAGQKKIGADQCGLCGMVYTINLPHDQRQHSIYHKRFLDSVKFNGWKKERIIASCTNGRILKILASDPKFAIRKVNEICGLIDIDLGFENSLYFSSTSSKVVYLFVSNQYQIAGCLVAEPVSRAYRLLSTSQNHAVSTNVNSSEIVVCGISRLWTYYPYRRQGVATKLLNAVRNTFVLGAALERNQIAFSDPTPDGVKFATKYCQSKEFLTYNSICL